MTNLDFLAFEYQLLQQTGTSSFRSIQDFSSNGCSHYRTSLVRVEFSIDDFFFYHSTQHNPNIRLANLKELNTVIFDSPLPQVSNPPKNYVRIS